MGVCVKIDLKANEGKDFNKMIKFPQGTDPRPLADQLQKDVEKDRDEWLDGSDYVDHGSAVAIKFDELKLVEGVVVEIVTDYRYNDMYIRAATKISKA